eukprot:6194489-Pleurochrysis_carterae.AAC.1
MAAFALARWRGRGGVRGGREQRTERWPSATATRPPRDQGARRFSLLPAEAARVRARSLSSCAAADGAIALHTHRTDAEA